MKDLLETNIEELKLGEKVDYIKTLKDERTSINDLSKKFTKQIELAEISFVEACKEAGTDIARGKLATASVTTEEAPNVEDWDALYDYIDTNKASYMLYKRIKMAPIQEMWNMGREIPGVTKIIKNKVSTKTL